MRIGSFRKRTCEAQTLRAIAHQLANGLRRLRSLLILLLLLCGSARSEHEREVHSLVVAGGVEYSFLGPCGEGRKLRTNHVAAILRNIQGPGTGDVGRGGIAFAGERVGSRHGHTGQWDVAALDQSVQPAACNGRRGDSLRR